MIFFQKPSRLSEANIQAEFYKQCKDNNIPVYLEYKIGKSRLDAIVYNKTTGEIIYIIETKSYKSRNKQSNVSTKQLLKYREFNTPIILISRRERVRNAIDYILSHKHPLKMSSITVI